MVEDFLNLINFSRFNLYDIKIATKAALEGCERMRRANKIENTCKCEMVLYNDDILVKN